MNERGQQLSGLIAPVERIAGVWRFERRGGIRTLAVVPPGHLLHYVVRGRCRLRIAGEVLDVGAGDWIGYAGGDRVESEFLSDYGFYSVSFHAPGLPAFAPSRRVMRGWEDAEKGFAAMEVAYRCGDALSAHARLLEILQRLRPLWTESGDGGVPGRRWRAVERYLAEKRLFHADVAVLCRRFHLSRATLLRDCRAATGFSPGRRLRVRRMNEALALLHCSDRNISEIAADLGYPRVQEFSREFTRFFGRSPRAVRAGNGDGVPQRQSSAPSTAEERMTAMIDTLPL